MSQQKLLADVIHVLEMTGSQHMVTGSFASSLQGEPRLTHDIDLVVSIPPSAVSTLMRTFPPPEYSLSEESIFEAISNKTMFNLLHGTEGDKVDFWMLTDEPFDVSRFNRRRKIEALGIHLWVSSPEDTILAKLRWSRMSGGSEKQLTDAVRVFEVQQEILDVKYLRDWVLALELEREWELLLQKAGFS